MSLIKRGNVVVTEFRDGSADVEVFGSLEEMMHHFLAHESFTGCWGNAEHLSALQRIRNAVDNVIDVVEEQSKP